MLIFKTSLFHLQLTKHGPYHREKHSGDNKQNERININ